jgi:hypothetical protein
LESLAQPAYIEGRYFDVLAANPLARALDPGLTVGRNRLRDLFLDPATQALHPQWETVTGCFIASLRKAVGSDIDDPRFIELTGELCLASAHFAKLWGRYEVRGQVGTRFQFDHPQVGELVLDRERMSIGGAEGMTLVVFHAEPGSADAEKLALLASAGLPTVAPRAEAAARA